MFCSAAGITWGKVVAMFAVAGALAVDCVRNGYPTTVHIIVDSLGQFVRKFLAPWLKRRGGWVGAIFRNVPVCALAFPLIFI